MIKPIQSSNITEEKIQYPKEATNEMIIVATEVVTALIKNRFITGGFTTDGIDKKLIYKKLSTPNEIKYKVQQMVNYKNNTQGDDKYSEGNIITHYVGLCNPHGFSRPPNPSVSKEIMDKYVNFFGYKVVTIETKKSNGQVSYYSHHLEPIKKN
jgi:hypothetical protein